MQFGESRWTRAIFITICLQAALAIIFEAVIYSYHQKMIDILNAQHLNQGADVITNAYANAQSLSVYFILFIIAQLFTVALVVDAVNQITYFNPVQGNRISNYIRPVHGCLILADISKEHHSTHSSLFIRIRHWCVFGYSVPSINNVVQWR